MVNKSGINKEWMWVIAGGPLQVPLITAIQKRGYKVIVSDINPDAPGMIIADQAIVIDTYDTYEHRKIANEMTEKPVAVLTAGADVGPTVSAVADELGLPAETFTVAERCRNKLKFREATTEVNPHPFFMEMQYSDMGPHSLWTFHANRHKINLYPCVVKPLERSGSKGVSLVHGPRQWYGAIKKARRADKRMHRNFIVEEKLSGPEIALDSFVENGKVIFANGCWRIFNRDRFGIEMGHLNPWKPPRKVLTLLRKVAIALGVTFGPFKCDMICDPRYGWTVLEVATRLSGGFDHMVTGKIVGRDVTGTMIDVALEKKINKRKLKAIEGKVACAYAPIFQPGKVTDWRIPEHPWLKEHFILTNDIQPLGNCTQRPLFLITEGESYFQAYRRARKAAKEVEPYYA